MEDFPVITNSASRALNFERIENRICPAVLIGLGSNGDLNISGDSAGPIAITALDADSYQVTDGITPLATIDGVTRGIRIDLGSSADVVTIDLAGQTVNGNVQINL